MQNVWLPAFRCTSQRGLRSIFSDIAAPRSQDPIASLHGSLWSSIAGATPWRPHASPPSHSHDLPVPNPTQPFLRQFHVSQSLSAKGPPPRRKPKRDTPHPTSKQRPSQDHKDGIRIPFRALPRTELATIFGQEVDYNTGNETLRILHARRVTGALVEQGIIMDPGGPEQLPEEALTKALEWLRQEYAVDEQSAAAQWAESESRKANQQYVERAENLGLYKKGTADEVKEEGEYSTTVTGKSAIEDFREYNKQKRKKEAEERKASGEEQRQQEMKVARREERMALDEKRAEKRKKWEKKALVSDMTEPPDLSMWERLFRPTLFVTLICLCMYNWSEHYTPPHPELRIFKEVPSSVATIGVLVAMNAGVWFLWRLPPFWNLLNTYTTSVPAVPYTFSLLGNTFSHSSFKHLMSNMIGLVLWGFPVHEDIGRANFLALYIAGGVLGSLGSLWGHVIVKRFTAYSQGASGSLYAIIATWGVLYWDKPKEKNLPTITTTTQQNTNDPTNENTPADPTTPNPKSPTPSTTTQTDLLPFLTDTARWALLLSSILTHFVPAAWDRIDGLAHIGGALVGIVGGWGIHVRRKREGRRERLKERGAGGRASFVGSNG